VDRLPAGPVWKCEPKWDGFRCLAFKVAGRVELRAKSGNPLTRYFPDVVKVLATIDIQRFVVDGELCVPMGDSLSFDALQMRLHPAESRVRKLSVESPAILILFDCLVDRDGRDIVSEGLTQRRAALERFVTAATTARAVRLSPYTRSAAEAQRWLDRVGGALD